MGRSPAIAALVVLLLAVAASTGAQEPQGWAYGYFREVMSPFCPGRTLDACTSSQAESLRMWILVQEAAGRSRDDVHAELLERYGDVILAAPQARGFGLAAYLLPLFVFLAGGLLVAVYLRRQTASASAAPAPQALDPDLERAIDEELAR